MLLHPTLCDPMDYSHQAPLPMDSPGKKTGLLSHSLPQGIFPTQGLNLGLLHRRQFLNHRSHREAQLQTLNKAQISHTCPQENQRPWWDEAGWDEAGSIISLKLPVGSFMLPCLS